MPLGTLYELAPVADALGAYWAGLFGSLALMSRQVAATMAAGPTTSLAVSAVVDPEAKRLLADPRLEGAGFVAARNALSDKALYLAWWQGESRQLLAESEAPDSGDPLDYPRHEWFRVPERTGERHVAGPYVDFVCTDEYVVTTTEPVIVDGTMVGVVGADTLVETLETMLCPLLREAGPMVTVVNAGGRAVASQSPLVATGSRVDVAGARERVDCPGLPFAVVAL